MDYGNYESKQPEDLDRYLKNVGGYTQKRLNQLTQEQKEKIATQLRGLATRPRDEGKSLLPERNFSESDEDSLVSTDDGSIQFQPPETPIKEPETAARRPQPPKSTRHPSFMAGEHRLRSSTSESTESPSTTSSRTSSLSESTDSPREPTKSGKSSKSDKLLGIGRQSSGKADKILGISGSPLSSRTRSDSQDALDPNFQRLEHDTYTGKPIQKKLIGFLYGAGKLSPKNQAKGFNLLTRPLKEIEKEIESLEKANKTEKANQLKQFAAHLKANQKELLRYTQAHGEHILAALEAYEQISPKLLEKHSNDFDDLTNVIYDLISALNGPWIIEIDDVMELDDYLTSEVIDPAKVQLHLFGHSEDNLFLLGLLKRFQKDPAHFMDKPVSLENISNATNEHITKISQEIYPKFVKRIDEVLRRVRADKPDELNGLATLKAQYDKDEIDAKKYLLEIKELFIK